MHDAHNGPCDYPNGPCPTEGTPAMTAFEVPIYPDETPGNGVPPGLTAMIDQAYEGTKREHAEMVTEIRKQISRGLDRDAILAGYTMFLMMRYNASELASLIALLTFEKAKEQA